MDVLFFVHEKPNRYPLLFLFLLLPTIVCAQETRQHPIDAALDTCLDKYPTTAGMADCFSSGYKKWDQELNKNYQTLMSNLNPAGKRLLKSAQLSWIAYRDNELKLIDSMYDEMQGTMYIPMRVDAKMQVVKQRALDLARHVDLYGN